MPDAKENSDVPEVEIVKPASAGNDGENRMVLARDILPDQLPIIPTGTRPFFPKMIAPVLIEDGPVKQAVARAVQSSSKYVGLALTRSKPEKEPGAPLRGKDVHRFGVVAEILRVNAPAPDAPMQVMLGVLERIKIEAFLQEEPVLIASVKVLRETEMAVNEELKAYSISILNTMKELIQLSPLFKEELNLFLSRANLNEPGRLADFSAAMTTATGEELQEILETLSIRARIEKSLILLKKELDITRIQSKINQQIEEKLSKQQREFFLREQLKAIKKELGLAKEGKESEIERFKERVGRLTLPEEAGERIREELDKLSLMDSASPEFTVSRNYLDWLTSLPWGITTPDRFDIRTAGRVLNRDHYGLEDVKERILEFLSVGVLKGRVSGSILCFVGPPGVGKTSIGQSIAESIGRKFFRFSLGGMRDEAEIKGHRRTYIGAMPGKFIQALKTCKSANPMIMLDEVDKIGASFQGDPASALLEVLDPAQNREFLDHYLDVRFDLSRVLFVCTANVLDTIPHALLDRMEVIKLPGYILEEKLKIAARYLIPKQLGESGLRAGQVKISKPALRALIDGYAREPGVRGLENHIKKIMRKAARKIVDDNAAVLKIEESALSGLLGRRLFPKEDPFKKPQPGVVTGLAWTSMGGDTLVIEAALVESEKPGFKQTGQLGNVMVESSEIAYTFIRAFLNRDERARKLFEHNLVHLHVPAGATPKDGPSAGITMAAALYSLATGRPIRPHIAMTGELTLTGKVMPIGGVKEKTIAAKRAGVKHIVFPKENRQDFDELPAHIRRGLKTSFVACFDEVIAACFAKAQGSVFSRASESIRMRR